MTDPENQHFTFTVYTGTRNRAHTLERPYRSLQAQTFRDFEWLVVDDKSTDGTTELIEKWQAEADFPIRYIRHANRGHHGSSNVAVQQARGELFLTLDSDDGAVPEALERFKAIWDDIPADRRDRYSAVTALATGRERCPDRGPVPVGHPRLGSRRSCSTDTRSMASCGASSGPTSCGNPVSDDPGLRRDDVERPNLGRHRERVPDPLRERVSRVDTSTSRTRSPRATAT